MNNRVIVISDDDDDDAKLTVYTANNKDIVVIDDSEDDINLPPASSNKCPTRTSRGESSLKRKRNSAEDEECLQNIKRKKTEHNPSESDNFGCDFNIYEPSITFTAWSSKAEPNSTKTHSHTSIAHKTATNPPSTCSEEGQYSTTKAHKINALEQNCFEKQKRVVVFNNTNSSRSPLSTGSCNPNHDANLNPDSKIVCLVCSQIFTGEDKSSMFLTHYTTAHLTNCWYCRICKLCDNPDAMKRSHMIKPPHITRCPFCPSGSTNEWTFQNLIKHFKDEHKEPANVKSRYLCRYSDCNICQASTQCCLLCIDKHVHVSEENALKHYLEEHGKVLTIEVYDVFQRSEHASMVADIDKDKLPSSSKVESMIKTGVKSSSLMNDDHSTTTKQSNAASMGKNLLTRVVIDLTLVENKDSAPSSSSVKRKRENSPCLLGSRNKSSLETNYDSTTTSKDGCSTQSNNSQSDNSRKRPRTRSALSNVSNTSSFPPPSAVLWNLFGFPHSPMPPSVTPQNLSKFSHIIFVDLDNWKRFVHLPRPLPSDVFVWGFCGGNYSNHCKKAWSVNFCVLVQERRFYQHPKCGKTKDAADFALCVQAARLDLQLPMHIPFTVLSGDKGFDELRNQLRSSARQIHLLDPHHVDQNKLYTQLASIGQK